MKTKKLIVTAILLIMCLIGTVFASEIGKVNVKPSPLHSTMQVITGEIPEFVNMTNKNLEKDLNKQVSDLYESNVNKAGKEKSPEINFGYEVKENEKYLSVVIVTSISAGNTSSEEVTTIVVDKIQDKQVKTLEDVLGKNAYKLSDKVINDKIKSEEKNNIFIEDGFKGTDKNTKFYVEDTGKVVVVFDKYEIASGAAGIQKFEIDSDIIDEIDLVFIMDKKEMEDIKIVKRDNNILVPFRSILERKDHKVTWDQEMFAGKAQKDKAIFIAAVGTDQLIVTADGQMGSAIITSAKTELVDAKLYIPIDALEIILGKQVVVIGNSVIVSNMDMIYD